MIRASPDAAQAKAMLAPGGALHGGMPQVMGIAYGRQIAAWPDYVPSEHFGTTPPCNIASPAENRRRQRHLWETFHLQRRPEQPRGKGTRRPGK